MQRGRKWQNVTMVFRKSAKNEEKSVRWRFIVQGIFVAKSGSFYSWARCKNTPTLSFHHNYFMEAFFSVTTWWMFSTYVHYFGCGALKMVTLSFLLLYQPSRLLPFNLEQQRPTTLVQKCKHKSSAKLHHILAHTTINRMIMVEKLFLCFRKNSFFLSCVIYSGNVALYKSFQNRGIFYIYV